MPTVHLTDRELPKLTVPEEGRVTYFDASLSGFGLRISAGGSRSWIVQYWFRGKKRRMTLGAAPLLGLADARAKAKELLARVTQGEDPAGGLKAEREAITVAALIDLYLGKYAVGPGGEANPRKRTWREDRRILATYIPRAWRSLPATTITRHQVRDIVEELAARAPVMANRFRACLSKVFSFAVGRDLVPFNPVVGVERQRETPRTRTFSDAELKAVWHAIEAEDPQTATIFKLALLLGARGGELRGLRRAELDLDGAVWSLPAERTKTKTARRIPLSRAAVELLRQVGGEYVFPGRHAGRGRSSIKDAHHRIVERSGVANWTPHDLRAACGTGLALLGHPTEIVARILGHTDRTITGRVYIRATNEGALRAALDAWARRLHAIVSGEAAAKVVPLRA